MKSYQNIVIFSVVFWLIWCFGKWMLVTFIGFIGTILLTKLLKDDSRIQCQIKQ